MVTKFLQQYLEDSLYVLTSNVKNLTATTSKPCVDVLICCENGLDGEIEIIYETKLYAFDGVVEIADVGSMVEEYFRKRNKVSDNISIEVDGVSIDINFLYCEALMPEDYDPTSSFLLSSDVQRVNTDTTFAVAAADRGTSLPYVVKAVGPDAENNGMTVFTKTINRQPNHKGTVYFTVKEIVGWAVDGGLSSVQYFSIEHGAAQKMFFIVPAIASMTFMFANRFNVDEYLEVVGEMTVKTTVSSSNVVCSGKLKPYDRDVERIYKVQTEPLMRDEISMYEQFLASHHIALCFEGNEYDIVITEHACEPSTDDGSLATVQFSWQFADKRPRIFDTLLDGILPSKRKIFDEHFSKEYE